MLTEVQVALVNPSLASQAVGPIASEIEITASGGHARRDIARYLRKGKHSRYLAKRVRGLRPLERQLVDPSDSALGPWSRYPAGGLRVKYYNAMIQVALPRQILEERPAHQRGRRRRRVRRRSTRQESEHQASHTAQKIQLGTTRPRSFTIIRLGIDWAVSIRPRRSAVQSLGQRASTHIIHVALFGAHLFNDQTRGLNNFRCSNYYKSAVLTDVSVCPINLATNGPCTTAAAM